MNRRTLIAGLGSISVAGGLTLGSGAFSRVSAERTVSVETARDSDALLRLVERGTGGRSGTNGGQLRFDLPSLREANRDSVNPENPQGLGTDSVYRFARDAGAGEVGLFAVQNQGTQNVRVWGDQPEKTDENGDPLPVVDIFEVESGAILTEANRSKSLAPGGDPIVCGLQVDTYGIPSREDPYNVGLSINAAVDGT